MLLFRRVLVMLATSLIRVAFQSVHSIDRNFMDKQIFSGIGTGVEQILLNFSLVGNITKKLGLRMTRNSMLRSMDVSCRHIPVRFSEYDGIKMRFMYNGTELPIDYFLQSKTMVLISDVPLKGSTFLYTYGYKMPLGAGQGMQVYQVQHSLYETEFMAFTNLYPFKATDLFFGIHHNIPVDIKLSVVLPPGYIMLSAAPDFPTQFTLKSRLNELVAVIMKGFAVVMVNNNKLRLAADQFYNTSYDESYENFGTEAAIVHKKLLHYFDQDLEGLMTVAIVPYLNVRPMIFGSGICLIDADVATTEPFAISLYMHVCMLHQHMSWRWHASEANFYYMFEGLRDMYALMEIEGGERVLMEYFVNVLRRDDHFTTATFMARTDDEFVSRSDVNQKTVIFLYMILNAHQSLSTFNYQILKILNSKQLLDDRLFCELMHENSEKMMGFPVDQGHFFTFFNRWVHSIGYPMVQMSLGKTLVFCLNNSVMATAEPFLIPFRFALAYLLDSGQTSIERIQLWLRTGSLPHEVPIRPNLKYYYANPNNTGLFRTFYDEANWKNLLKNQAELDIPTKISIIVDGYYFFRHKKLKFDIVLRSLAMLERVTQHMMWDSVDYVIAELEMFFRESALHGWFLAYLRRISIKYYLAHEDRAMVATRFACMAKLPICLKESYNMLTQFVTYRFPLPNREAILCSGMRAAKPDYYLYMEYLVATTSRDRNVFLMAMTCMESQALLMRLLGKIFLRDEFGLTKDYKYRLYLHTFLSGVEGGRAAWRFLLLHNKLLFKLFTDAQVEHMLTLIAKVLNKRHQYRLMKRLLSRLGVQRELILNDMSQRFYLLRHTESALKKVMGSM